MESILNWIITYLNPINLLNLLWELCVDFVYLVAQWVVDLLTILISTINWLCPVFPNLSPPPIVLSVARKVAWVIPWHYASRMVVVMIGLTIFAIMVSWSLRWAKIIR